MVTKILLTIYLWISCGIFLNHVKAQASAMHKQQVIKVMTYNIHHANPPSRAKDSLIDLEAIANVINKVKPDLVALQEVDVNNGRAGINLNEAAVLAKLTGMKYHFTSAMLYRGGEYGDAVLSRFPVLDTVDYHLPVIGGTKEEIRSLSMIRVKLSGQEIYFASTHLGLTKDTRLLQAEKITGIIPSLSLPLILAGDFNATPESETIKVLDKVLTRSCKSDCALTIPTKSPTHKIDYIMYTPSGRFKVLDVRTVDETYASDHLPVVASFILK